MSQLGTPLMAQKAQKFLKYAQHFFMKNSLKSVDTPKGFVLGRMVLFSSLHLIFLRFSKTKYGVRIYGRN